jgi:hypothetical protein
MKVEEIFGDLPLDRLWRELANRIVTIELFLIDNSPAHFAVNEQRFRERNPHAESTATAVRDFTALHYSPLLAVWNHEGAGLQSSPELGLEDVMTPAVRLFSVATKITGFRPVALPREAGAEFALVRIENTADVDLLAPMRSLAQAEKAATLTITQNPLTDRKEYAIRMYNAVLTISV